FGGVQLGRHFPLAPREINHPLPRLAGEAESASAVELYVDGALSARAQVEAGPFALEDAPLISGAGQAQLVITDMLGRQQIISRPFYVSTALLRPGLSDWTVSAGAQRRGFGAEDFDYGAGFAAARYRVGVSDHFTAEAALEWTEGGGAGQVGGAFAHPWLGQLSLSYASNGEGDAFAFAWLHEARAWAFGVQGETRDADFSALGARQGAASTAAASLYLRMGAFGDLALTAAGLARAGAADARTFSIAYTPDLRDLSLNFRLAYTERTQAELSFGIGLSVPLDGDVSASLAGQWDRRGETYRAGAQHSAPIAGGLGWRVRAVGGAYERVDAALSYRGPAADARARAAWSQAGAGLRLELTGAIGWIDEYAFAGRAIHGAF
ncbi:MAG TPA: fimbria/pilus outer membrane usher protein, partial [Terricaulis sp.]|nr:fimbria/pilus outer membrane usher protein [Terricaulis sp.]